MGNVTVAWEDVWAVVEQVLPQLITIIVVLALAIVVAVVVAVKIKKPLKGLVAGNAFIAFGLIAVIIVHLMLAGPLYNTLNVVLTDGGELRQETVEASRQLIEEITNEGRSEQT